MTNTIKRYSEAFRRQVVSEYENGASKTGLQKKYGITGQETINNWIRKYGKEGFRHELIEIQTADEIRRVRELEKQVQELQQALGQMTLEKLKLESILEVIQEEKQEVKKNEQRSSKGSLRKSSNKANSE